MNRAKAEHLRKLEEDLRQNLHLKKMKQQEILMETFYKHRESSLIKKKTDQFDVLQISGYTDLTQPFVGGNFKRDQFNPILNIIQPAPDTKLSETCIKSTSELQKFT